MKRRQMDILGVSKMRWTGSGKTETDGMTTYYSGGTKQERGVGIILDFKMSRAVISWEPVNDRIVIIRLQRRKPVTKFGGQFGRFGAFFSCPPIFQFWGDSYIDESETNFKVQTPVSVKQPTEEKTKRGRS